MTDTPIIGGTTVPFTATGSAARAPLTSAFTRKAEIERELADLRSTFKTREAQMLADLRGCATVIAESSAGLDPAKIALGRTVIGIRGTYAKAGQDRADVIRDAIHWLATGEKGGVYRPLDQAYYGTKNYDAWSGQRTDCEYGMGPSHGSICFAVEASREVRSKGWAYLDEEQREAAVYLLTNLAEIEAAAQAVPA